MAGGNTRAGQGGSRNAGLRLRSVHQKHIPYHCLLCAVLDGFTFSAYFMSSPTVIFAGQTFILHHLVSFFLFSVITISILYNMS